MLDDINSMLDYELKQAAFIGKAIDIILQPKSNGWHDDRQTFHDEGNPLDVKNLNQRLYGGK